MIRLLATVWKATEAIPWHVATRPIARTAKARLRARRQKTGVANWAGFFHTSRPTHARTAMAQTTPKTSHQRRRAAGDVKVLVRRIGCGVRVDEVGEWEAAPRRVAEDRAVTGRLPSWPGAARAR